MGNSTERLNQSAAAYMEARNIKDAKSYKERVIIFWDAIRHAISEEANIPKEGKAQ